MKKMEDMSKEGGEEEGRDEKKEKGAKEGEGEAKGGISKGREEEVGALGPCLSPDS